MLPAILLPVVKTLTDAAVAALVAKVLSDTDCPGRPRRD